MNKVNIFHEWLDTSGGAESVLAELLGIYPDATVYTLWAEPKLIKSLGVEVKVSLLQFLPPKSRRSLGLLFMPLAWKILGRNISSGDFSITSSWVFCHSAVPKKFEKNSVHYIHTPARYWWNPEVDTRTELKVPRIILLILRSIDKLLARNLVLPAYEQCVKANHMFNLLDARGVISVTERAGYISRVRALAQKCCQAWIAN